MFQGLIKGQEGKVRIIGLPIIAVKKAVGYTMFRNKTEETNRSEDTTIRHGQVEGRA